MKHTLTTVILGFVLLLILVGCSGQSQEKINASLNAIRPVALFLSEQSGSDTDTHYVGLCVVQWKGYPTNLDEEPVVVDLEPEETQFELNRVQIDTIPLPARSYYLIELVLRDDCGSSIRFIHSDQYFSSHEELVLRFRGNQTLGFSDEPIDLNFFSFLLTLDEVTDSNQIPQLLHGTEGKF